MSTSDSAHKKATSVRQKKSTLTQQQKNKKRQRATPQQLQVLLDEFTINNTPNSKRREEIGQKIDMTERSVQIWFQNKRAKSKRVTNRININIHNGSSQKFSEATSMVSPTSVSPNKQLLAQETSMLSLTSNDYNEFISTASLSKNSILLSCFSINIGSWRENYKSDSGLEKFQVLFSFEDATINYILFNSTKDFLIKVPMEHIEMVTYMDFNWSTKIADLQIKSTKCPLFYIKSLPTADRWFPCQDFTERLQASSTFFHKLTGPASLLKSQLLLIHQLYPQKFCGLTKDISSDDVLFTRDYSDLSLEIIQPLIVNSMAKSYSDVSLNEKANFTSVLPLESANQLNFIQTSVSNTCNNTPDLEPNKTLDTILDGVAIPYYENFTNPTDLYWHYNTCGINSSISRHNSATSTDTIGSIETEISSLESFKPAKNSRDSMFITEPINLHTVEETKQCNDEDELRVSSRALPELDIAELSQDNTLFLGPVHS